MVELSIIILNYNTKELLLRCLESIEKSEKELDFEVIVVDNASIDGSPEEVIKKFPKYKVIVNERNLGFAKGNNAAKKIAKGKYILFLNSDTEVEKDSISKTLNELKNNSQVGAITCKVVLKSGQPDLDTRRSFPTPWVALTHFSKMDRAFPTNKFFAKYWYGGYADNLVMEVDVIQGAFFMSPKKVLDEVGWFDESYFLDGEDIDLCWKIKHNGYKIIYWPIVKITHIKKASKTKNQSTSISKGVDSMEIFYRKRLWKNYPIVVNYLVLMGIKMVKLIRLIKQ